MLTLIILTGVAGVIFWQAFSDRPAQKNDSNAGAQQATTSDGTHTQKIVGGGNLIHRAAMDISHRKNKN